jgi:hypothetical protein
MGDDAKSSVTQISAEVYLRAAEMHLKRTEVIQGIEWRITALFWTLLVVFTSTVVIYPEIRSGAWCLKAIGTGLLAAMSVAYVVFFCPEAHRSLSSERFYYLYMRGRALKAAQIPDGFVRGREILNEDSPDAPPPGMAEQEILECRGKWEVRKSGLFAFKVLVTVALFCMSTAALWAPARQSLSSRAVPTSS